MAFRISPLEARTLAAFTGALRARFGGRLVDVALFGSRARGEGDVDSDLDIYVCVAGLTSQERRAIVDDADVASSASGLRLSPLVRAPGALSDSSALARAIERDRIAL